MYKLLQMYPPQNIESTLIVNPDCDQVPERVKIYQRTFADIYEGIQSYGRRVVHHNTVLDQNVYWLLTPVPIIVEAGMI